MHEKQEQAKEHKIMEEKEDMGKHSPLTNNCRDNLSSTKRKKIFKRKLAS